MTENRSSKKPQSCCSLAFRVLRSTITTDSCSGTLSHSKREKKHMVYVGNKIHCLFFVTADMEFICTNKTGAQKLEMPNSSVPLPLLIFMVCFDG